MENKASQRIHAKHFASMELTQLGSTHMPHMGIFSLTSWVKITRWKKGEGERKRKKSWSCFLSIVAPELKVPLQQNNRIKMRVNTADGSKSGTKIYFFLSSLSLNSLVRQCQQR